ncbi:MAG: hypothetical protein ABSD89_12230 [Halobacteriota archaeon]
MEKVIRNGKVAVLYSPGFGAGWYSWIHVPEVLFDPEIVALVEANKNSEIPALVEKKYGAKYYTGGADGLSIEWLPVGTQFEISEYDGSEDVRIFGPDDGFTA